MALIIIYKAPNKFNFLCPLPMHDARMKSFRGFAVQLLNLSEAAILRGWYRSDTSCSFASFKHANLIRVVLIRDILKQITEIGGWRTRQYLVSVCAAAILH